MIAARGTIFPSCRQGDNLIHGKPISPQNVKVSVDDVVAKFQITPLPVPCDEHDTTGDAAGSFVQCPKDLVDLGQVLIIINSQVLTVNAVFMWILILLYLCLNRIPYQWRRRNMVVRLPPKRFIGS